MKRFFKFVSLVLLVVVLVPVIVILSVVACYYHVVHATPGNLAVNVAPGPLGKLVDPFIATGGFPWMCGLDTPAAMTPFGMVRLGPDTACWFLDKNGLNRSGYWYGDNKIIGFSHTRLVGADSQEGGVFRILPASDAPLDKFVPEHLFARFSHANEMAFPGFYAVKLNNGIKVELTATPHVGVHRYTFGDTKAPCLLLNVSSCLGDGRTENAAVAAHEDKQELEGSVRTYGSFSGRYGGLDVYFFAKVDKPFGFESGDVASKGKKGAATKSKYAKLTFAQGETVEVRVGLSCVSIANARENLAAEAGQKSLDQIAAEARDTWEERLGRIQIEGGEEHQQRTFYTALYHAFGMPTNFTDVNKDYKGFDRSVHKADGFTYYTDFSLWDTFRTAHPLYSLVARGEQRDMMRSLLAMAQQGGAFPRWPSGCGYTNCMFGTPADVAVTEAYLKGIKDFDAEAAYKAMRETGLTGKPANTKFGGRDGFEQYLKLGYVPDEIGDSVAETVEYGGSDNAIANLAQALGHTDDVPVFQKHAQNYHNLFNPETQFFQGRDAQGNFFKEFRPELLTYLDFKHKYTRAYVEGSAWQWRWGGLYDAQGLIGLFKSREFFVEQLNKFFEKSTKKVGAWSPGSYYWMGNQPDIHSVYLFNEAGRPDLTQKWVRWILKTKFKDTYYGLDGNDDGGTISSWYVLSALGFYPVVGTTKYELCSPLFPHATVHIGDKVLKIIADNDSAENVYVQQVTLNGQPLNRSWFTHDEIANGGTLHFTMGAKPK